MGLTQGFSPHSRFLIIANSSELSELLVSSPQLLVKTKSGSLQLVWIPRPALPKTAPERGTTRERARNPAPRHRNDRILASPSTAPPSTEENNAIHPAPDWNEELRLAAKNALANELAQKRHEMDFAHAYPMPVKKPPQFAWDYAATHRRSVNGDLFEHRRDQ
jgi:hypothetical protein